jgi:hypothetical protein
MINEITTSTALSSLGIQEWVLKGEPHNEETFEQCFGKVTGVDDNGTGIVSHDPEDFGVTWDEVVAETAKLKAEAPMVALRAERDRLLAETDWWASSDIKMGDEHKAYRQALRDITKGGVAKAEIPVKPANPVI